MFDEVTKKQTGKYAARRVGWVFGSTAFQLGMVALALMAGQKIKAAIEEKPVDVKFVRAAAPPRPPPPPPPAAPPKRKDAPKPPVNAPPPPPPQALIQPKDVQAEMKEDTSPKEPEYDYGPQTGEGVVGGVVGARAIEDAPAYATAGYKKPTMAEPGCVQRSVRISSDLLDYISGPVTVKFAISRDGSPEPLRGDVGHLRPAHRQRHLAGRQGLQVESRGRRPGSPHQHLGDPPLPLQERLAIGARRRPQ